MVISSNYKIQTSRLSLNVITLSDLDAVFQTMNSRWTAEIVSFLHWPITMDQAEWWCKQSEEEFKKQTALMFIARHKDDDAPVGCIGVHHIKENGTNSAETGYWITEKFQRQGYVSEMLKGVIEFGFNELGLDSLWATTAYDNPVSDRVLEKQGFELTGEKDVIRPDGSIRRSKLFELYKTT